MKTSLHLDIYDARHRAQAASIIKDGGTVVFPTETVYGLGADAGNPHAIAKIFAAKGRPADNPLIVHVANQQAFLDASHDQNQLSLYLVEHLQPGPVSIIVQRSEQISSATSTGLATVGLRIPQLDLCRDFLALCGCPVAAPSANLSGQPSPTNFAMACRAMDGRADAILSGPPSQLGLESAILYAADDQTLHVLRPGQIDLNSLKIDLAKAGFVGLSIHLPGSGQHVPPAPGTRHRHYAPHAKVYLYYSQDQLKELVQSLCLQNQSIALLAEPSQAIASQAGRQTSQFTLMPDGNYSCQAASLSEYEQSLYRLFFDADDLGCKAIVAWCPHQDGIFGQTSLALQDRLQRAAGKLN